MSDTNIITLPQKDTTLLKEIGESFELFIGKVLKFYNLWQNEE